MYIDFLHVQRLVATRIHSYNELTNTSIQQLSMQRVYPVYVSFILVPHHTLTFAQFVLML